MLTKEIFWDSMLFKKKKNSPSLLRKLTSFSSPIIVNYIKSCRKSYSIIYDTIIFYKNFGDDEVVMIDFGLELDPLLCWDKSICIS